MEAQKVRGKNVKKTGSVDQALKFIKALYSIERWAKKQELSSRELYELRQKEAKPVLEEMHQWLLKKFPHVVPRSLLGKAIKYTLNQWERLKAYVDFGHTTPDNNLAENAIRPFLRGPQELVVFRNA